MKYKCISVELAQICATPFRFKRGVETAIALGVGSVLTGIIGNEMSNEANSSNISDTNATNLQIARERNEAQKQLVEQQNKYNSIVSQLQRGREAGVNPNTVLGGQLAGNLQTEVPDLIAPMMQAFQNYKSPMQDFSQNFQQITEAFQGVRKTESELQGVNWDNKLKEIEAKWSDFQHEWNLNLSKQTFRTLAGQEVEAYQHSTLMRQTGRQVQALLCSTNLDNYDKVFRNMFSRELYDFGVKKLESEIFANLMDGRQARTSAHVMMQMLPANLGLVGSQSFFYKSQGQYFKDLSSLTPENRRYLQSLTGLNDNMGYNTWLDAAFKVDSWSLRLQREHLQNRNIWSSTRKNIAEGTESWGRYKKTIEEERKLKFENSMVFRAMQLNEMFAKSMMMYGSAFSDFTGGQGMGSLLKGSPKIGF